MGTNWKRRWLRNVAKNLIVAATGTGKTIIAALDYKNYCLANGNRRPRLLFIAHRDEILNQNLATIRNVLKDPNFGARMGGYHDTPADMSHVFCTIQTANSKEIWKDLGRDYYEFIVVDEAHHAPASSYKGVFTEFSPKVLLGLRPRPSAWRGGRVADPVSVEDDRFWQAGKYNITALEQAYVDDVAQADKRVKTIIDALNRYQLGNLGRTKGLGF